MLRLAGSTTWFLDFVLKNCKFIISPLLLVVVVVLDGALSLVVSSALWQRGKVRSSLGTNYSTVIFYLILSGFY